MKENIKEDAKDFEQWLEFTKKDENLIGFAKSSNPNDSIKLKQFVNILSDYKRVLKENEELNKKIASEENEKVILWLHKQRNVLQDLLEEKGE